MVQDAVAVIPEDASVDILEAKSTAGSADMYERLLKFCRGEVSIALLGQNQTTESDSTHASANAGLEVGRDLRDGDAGIVEETINELIGWIVDLNAGPEAPRLVFSMWEQEETDQLRAARDKTLVDAGARLTRTYFMRTYGLAEEDIDAVAAPAGGVGGTGVPPVSAGAEGAFAEDDGPQFTPAQQAVESLIADALAAGGVPGVPAEELAAAVRAARDPHDLEVRLAALVGRDAPAFSEALGQALFAAQVLGYVAADERRT